MPPALVDPPLLVMLSVPVEPPTLAPPPALVTVPLVLVSLLDDARLLELLTLLDVSPVVVETLLEEVVALPDVVPLDAVVTVLPVVPVIEDSELMFSLPAAPESEQPARVTAEKQAVIAQKRNLRD